MKLFCLLSLALLLSLSLADLRFVSPYDLAQHFSELYPYEIPYSIANFGDVPYGRSLTGTLATPLYLENCIYEDVPDPLKSGKVFLVERNDCSFTQKALNVQK